MLKYLLKTILILTLIAMLAACQQPTQAPEATATATQSAVPSVTATAAATLPPTTASGGEATAYPAGPGSGDYPAPEGATGGDYPPPAAGVPVLDNLSIVKATLVERGTDPQVPGHERLTVNLLESAAAQGMPSRTDDLIGEQVVLYAETAGLPDLQPGDTFTAEVEYRGDEAGGRFYAAKIEKQ